MRAVAGSTPLSSNVSSVEGKCLEFAGMDNACSTFASMKEATVKDTDSGRMVESPGWFIVNVAELSWESVPGGGIWCSFEADHAPNEQVGIGVHVLAPDEPNGLYHAESNQEGFLVLSGECVAVVEGEERRLRQWDYLHCPPGTYHITVGAGKGPCAILMMGARSPDRTIHYPVDATAARYGASVARETSSPKEAYADWPRTITRERAPWPPATSARPEEPGR